MSDADREAVLFANEAFYAAFASGDPAAMRAVWAEDVPVSCIHPGWAALTTAQDVQDSWEAILQSPPPVRCRLPRAFVYGDTATVLCFEEISGSYLLATNVFVRQGPRWSMVHHHAGVTNATPTESEEQSPPSIN